MADIENGQRIYVIPECQRSKFTFAATDVSEEGKYIETSMRFEFHQQGNATPIAERRVQIVEVANEAEIDTGTY